MTAMLPRKSARPLSQTIITVRRFQRSTSAPAGSASRKYGAARNVATSPACAGELVSASASSGNARCETCVPISETACPASSRMNSRLRQSGLWVGEVVSASGVVRIGWVAWSVVAARSLVKRVSCRRDAQGGLGSIARRRQTGGIDFSLGLLGLLGLLGAVVGVREYLPLMPSTSMRVSE